MRLTQLMEFVKVKSHSAAADIVEIVTAWKTVRWEGVAAVRKKIVTESIRPKLSAQESCRGFCLTEVGVRYKCHFGKL